MLGAILGGLGSVLGGFAQGQAQNRGQKFSGQMDMERMLLDREQQLQNQQLAREQEGRNSGQFAWRKLLSAQHLGNPGAKPQLAGPYNVAPRMPSEVEQHGADALTHEVMQRLVGQNPMAPVAQHASVVDPKLLDAGKWEKILGFLSPGLMGAGAMMNTRPRSSGMSGLSSGDNQSRGY